MVTHFLTCKRVPKSICHKPADYNTMIPTTYSFLVLNLLPCARPSQSAVPSKADEHWQINFRYHWQRSKERAWSQPAIDAKKLGFHSLIILPEFNSFPSFIPTSICLYHPSLTASCLKNSMTSWWKKLKQLKILEVGLLASVDGATCNLSKSNSNVIINALTPGLSNLWRLISKAKQFWSFLQRLLTLCQVSKRAAVSNTWKVLFWIHETVWEMLNDHYFNKNAWNESMALLPVASIIFVKA